MSELHIRQIRAMLERTFGSSVDLSDLKERPASEVASSFLSRSLAALALAHFTSLEPKDAGATVVDGFHDNGVDAILYHVPERVLYLVQSKWRHDGTGSVERGDVQKFLKGVKDLINARWDRFSPKIQARKSSIEAALNDAGTKIVLVLCYSGQASLSEEVKRDLEDAVSEMNDPVDLVSSQVLRQGDIYAIVSRGLGGAPIDLDVQLYEWGQIREPIQGFYGQVAASDVASWLTNYQNRLFVPNLRVFLGSTEVNAHMVETLTKNPEHFWYFNNGVTALCRRISKKPIGGNTHETGVFECSDLRVVNGAQTAGAIAEAFSKAPDRVARARVWLRLVSLEACPEGFDKEITRRNNSQNRIERRDFVALDAEQERIASELALEGVTYLYKSGETVVDYAAGCDLAEATVARACRQDDVSYAVHAKAEIGRLWEDITRAPYKVLFNRSVSGPSVWRLVQILRSVESRLLRHRNDAEGRKRLLAVHGNRFIVHAAMKQLPDAILNGDEALDESVVTTACDKAFSRTLAVVNNEYPDAYLANLFKNIEKCKAVINRIDTSLK